MWPYRQLPSAAEAAFRARCGAAVPLGLFPTDLGLDGKLRRVWLALTAERIVQLDAGAVTRELPLAELRASRIEELCGASSLQVETAAGWNELARASKAFVPELGVLQRALEEQRLGRPLALPDTFETACCPSCDRPLSERGAICSRCFAAGRVVRRLGGLARPYRLLLLLLFLATGLGVLLQLAPPYLTKLLIDRVVIPRDAARLPAYIALLLGFGLLAALLRMVSGWLTAWIGGRVSADLRAQVHAALQHIELRALAKRESGEIVSRVMNDTGELQRFLVDGSTYILVELLMLAGVGVMMVRLDPQLTVMALLPVPLLLLGGRWFMRWVHPRFHRLGSRVAALHSVLGESIRGLRTVKVHAAASRRVALFACENSRLFGAQVAAERVFAIFFEGFSWAMVLGLAAVWAQGAWRLAAARPGDTLTLGTLMAFVGYIWLFYGPLQWFSAAFNWMTRALAAAERVFLLLDAPRERSDGEAGIDLGRLRGEVTFEEVRFSYDRGHEVIRGVSFQVRPGEMIGLVGRSGAGKSTLINLLCRFYDVDSGRILIDGRPIRDLRLEPFRRQIGIVMQDPFLFNASIRDNIACGRPDADFDDVVRAARAAHAHDFIVAREDGYDTLVGEGGATLSGGERQRLAIARAILHDPPILILDEATAAVDTETEQAIQEAMRTLVQGRTTLAIAHRLSTLRNAHRLLVIDDGQLVESGTHDELLAADGSYARLVRLQSEVTRLRAESSVWQEEAAPA